jgi:hypothetical protein
MREKGGTCETGRCAQIVVPSNFNGLPRLAFLASPAKTSAENDEDKE